MTSAQSEVGRQAHTGEFPNLGVPMSDLTAVTTIAIHDADPTGDHWTSSPESGCAPAHQHLPLSAFPEGSKSRPSPSQNQSLFYCNCSFILQ